ncbi:MAG: PQQ-binding-like beta-propeller repeat protein, partial [Candidatus Eisenbacteria bacterium]|nr:PQQ-binding-like beta-propeller repeat protein [Candidatus Eisenbacteria bacterium]
MRHRLRILWTLIVLGILVEPVPAEMDPLILDDEPAFVLDLYGRVWPSLVTGELSWTIADVIGDESEEWINTNPSSISLVSINNRRMVIHWEDRLADPWRHNRRAGAGACVDVDGDGARDILRTRALGDTLVLDVISGEGELLLSCAPLVPPAGDTLETWDVRLSGCGVIVNRQSGRRLIIAAAARGPVADPRAVIAYDARTGEEMWRYSTGPNPQSSTFEFIDLNHDGQEEILFTMESPDNPRFSGETSGRKAYLIALGVDGRSLWVSVLGAGFCHPIYHALLWRNEKVWAVVTATSQHKPSLEEDEGPSVSLSIWEARTGTLLSTIPSSISFSGLVRTGPASVMAAQLDGTISVYKA